MPPLEGSLEAKEGLLLLRAADEAVTSARAQARRVHVLQGLLLVAILVAWWAASGTLVDPLFFSDPVSIGAALVRIIADGSLWWHLEYTLIETIAGYMLGVAAGIATALIVSILP